MDLKHFGDSYDVVKKSLISWLGALGPWVGHPMFTRDVKPEEAYMFSQFLGVPLISRPPLRKESDRDSYFAICHEVGHLFMDPDTRLKLGSSKGPQPQKYLFGDELIRLASIRPQFLTLIFDQCISRSKDVRDQIRQKLEYLADRNLIGFAYTSHACFIAVGRDRSIVKIARDTLLRNSRLPGDRIRPLI